MSDSTGKEPSEFGTPNQKITNLDRVVDGVGEILNCT